MARARGQALDEFLQSVKIPLADAWTNSVRNLPALRDRWEAQ
jgi:hypothetical protein